MRNEQKYSPDARKLLSGEPAGAEKVRVLVGTRGQISESERHQLEETGANIGSVAGNVLTAELPAARLESLGDFDFVESVELSRPLYPEKPDSAAVGSDKAEPGEFSEWS